jgi:cysteine desulfurase
MNTKHAKHMTKLRDKLIDEVMKKIPDTLLNGPKGDNRLCNNVNFSFLYVEGEAIGAYLDAEGICSSTGSACSSKSLEPSHVLIAIGLKPEQAHGSLRLSLSRFTTEEEINKTLKVLPGIIEKLRKMSPLTKLVKKML